MTISAETRIGSIIKYKLEAIDVLVSLSPHFKKLKNPILRKIFAPRVTVAEAAIIGNCKVENILDGLARIGFEVNNPEKIFEEGLLNAEVIQNNTDVVSTIDVRHDLANGIDPFNKIMKQLSEVPSGKTMLVINSFEPAPLIRILKGKGHSISVSKEPYGAVFTYITKNDQNKSLKSDEAEAVPNPDLFDSVLKNYYLKFTKIDVREMAMPQPMIAILDELDRLNIGEALYVRHKKIPLFLFPELKDRNFNYVYKQAETEVILIIYHKHE